MWPDTADLLVKWINDAEDEYENSKSVKNLVLNLNFSNILVAFGKVSTIYTLAAYAFNDNIPWTSDGSLNNINVVASSGESWV